jgi:hypothetical protein
MPPDWLGIGGAVTGGIGLALHAVRYWTLDRRRIKLRWNFTNDDPPSGLRVEVTNSGGRAAEIRTVRVVAHSDAQDRDVEIRTAQTSHKDGDTLAPDHEMNFAFPLDEIRKALAKFEVTKRVRVRVSLAGGKKIDSRKITIPPGPAG